MPRILLLRLLRTTGAPITFIVVSGGPYSSDSGAGRENHLRPLLNDWFAAIGAEDMKLVHCDPTGK